MTFIEKHFSELNAKERGKILIGSILPRPIAWISSLNPDNSVNLAPFSYFTVLNSHSVAVSFRREDGRQKDTAINILREGEAVIQIADQSLIHELDLSSKRLPFGESEVDLVGVDLMMDTDTDWRTPAVSATKVHLHVQLMNHLEVENFAGDAIESDLILLRVVRAYLDDSIYDAEKNYISHEDLAALSRLGGPYFANYSEIKDYKREF